MRLAIKAPIRWRAKPPKCHHQTANQPKNVKKVLKELNIKPKFEATDDLVTQIIYEPRHVISKNVAF